MDEMIEVKSFGKVTAKKGANARTPYFHQAQAMKSLDIIDKEESFRTLVVLPTGGGKAGTEYYYCVSWQGRTENYVVRESIRGWRSICRFWK